jgi:hypothetical protein
MADERQSLARRLFTGNIFSQGTIEQIVQDFLAHPRRHNAMFERLLFLLTNAFLRAAQKHERGWFVKLLEEQSETAESEETQEMLANLILAVNSREYIYSDFRRKSDDDG